MSFLRRIKLEVAVFLFSVFCLQFSIPATFAENAMAELRFYSEGLGDISDLTREYSIGEDFKRTSSDCIPCLMEVDGQYEDPSDFFGIESIGLAEKSASKSVQSFSTLSNPLPSQAEYDALMDFYQATNGANWSNNAGWSTADPNVIEYVGDWHGVGVDANGHVTLLMLHHNNLSGTIPLSIQNLNNLTFLWLFVNNLTGTIPNVFHQFPNLEQLHLGSNQLTGTIPPDLGSSTSIQDLRLYKNQLTGTIPTNLSNIQTLKWLVLYDNSFSGGIPSGLGNLQNLEYLYLYRAGLSGTIPSSLGGLQSLIFLGLHTSDFSGSIPESFGNLSNLKTLLMSGNSLSGSIPSSLGNLGNLEQLSLENNNLTGSIPSQLGNMNKVYYLYLNNNKLSGSIPSSLCNATSLKHLRLSNNSLQGAVSACLLTKGLNDLWIARNYFNFENLQEFYQASNSISDYSPQYLEFVDTVYVQPNGLINLTVEDGNYLGAQSSYRWMKNGVYLHASAPSNKVLNLNCITGTCEGKYTLEITNSDFPGVVISGDVYQVKVGIQLNRTICEVLDSDSHSREVAQDLYTKLKALNKELIHKPVIQ